MPGALGETYQIEVAWTGQLTGVFIIGTSLIDGPDVIAGVFGSNAFDDISADVISVECSRGRANDMAAIQQGRCTIRLIDVRGTGKYNPENSGRSLNGYLVPMRPVRVRCTHSGTTYGIFYGYISSIEHDPEAGESIIQAVDFFEWLNLAKVTIVELTNRSPDYLIGQVLDAVGWTDPNMRNLDASGDSVPSFSMDGSRSALQAIEDILAIERGIFFVNGDGVTRFISRDGLYANGTPAATFTGAEVRGLKTGVEKDRIINGQTVTRVGGTAQTATDSTSRGAYGYRDGNPISSEYLASDSQANSLASWIIAMNKDPRAPARELGMVGADATRMTQILTREIGDLVTINESAGGTNFNGRIQSIAHKIERGGLHEWRATVQKTTVNAFTIRSSLIDGPDVIVF